VPAIKGAMYINIYILTSQPALIKLDNENIGGHRTPLHSASLNSHNDAQYTIIQKTR